MATVIIPTPLRKFTQQQGRVTVKAGNVSEAVDRLTSDFPNLRKHLLGADGKVASFINIFVDSDDIRSLQQEQTQVGESSIISIIPAIAGGII